jgi:radical SAM protein with 4Fe4S-binding SPASM domain
MEDLPENLTFTYEFSRTCNLRCRFCYNAWKAGSRHREGELSTEDAISLLGKVIEETHCASICISGGEPMLRDDVYEVISFIKRKAVKVILVSNGTRLTPDAIRLSIDSGVDAFQVTLLSDNPQRHNALAGGESFEEAVEAILGIKKAGRDVSTFFVAVSENVDDFVRTLELNTLLGVGKVAIGRFNPGGAGLEGRDDMMPNPAKLQDALEGASEFCTRYPISVSISTPILPCLNDVSKYENISLGFCAAGSRQNALMAIDPLGNLKVCSHSPYSLGNLLEEPFADLLRKRFFLDFAVALPEYCRDCTVADVCRGGCRSAAHVCYGSLTDEDPYLRRWKRKASKSRASLLKSRRDAPQTISTG